MSTTHQPARPGAKPDTHAIVASLREHLDVGDAEMLAARLETYDRDKDAAHTAQEAKRRLLNRHPRP